MNLKELMKKQGRPLKEIQKIKLSDKPKQAEYNALLVEIAKKLGVIE